MCVFEGDDGKKTLNISCSWNCYRLSAFTTCRITNDDFSLVCRHQLIHMTSGGSGTLEESNGKAQRSHRAGVILKVVEDSGP